MGSKTYFLSLLLSTLLFSIGSAQDLQEFRLQSGMKVVFVSGSNIPLIQARLSVRHLEKRALADNFLLFQLLLLNMFNREAGENNLFAKIAELGGDFRLNYTPEVVILDFQFLSENLSGFSDFLKELFSFSSFQSENFNTSRELLKKQLLNPESFAQQALQQEVIFSRLYQTDFFSTNRLSWKVLQRLNPAQINSLYKNIFLPKNATLILQGSVHPQLTIGMIEKRFFHFPKSKPTQTNLPEIKVGNQEQIFYFPLISGESSSTITICEIFPILTELSLDEQEFFFRLKLEQIVHALSPRLLADQSAARFFTIHFFPGQIIISFKFTISQENIPQFIYNYLRLRKQITQFKIDRISYLENLKNFLGTRALAQLDPLEAIASLANQIRFNSLFSRPALRRGTYFISWDKAQPLFNQIENSTFSYPPLILINSVEHPLKFLPDLSILEIGFN